jgi:hypothetical protein
MPTVDSSRTAARLLDVRSAVRRVISFEVRCSSSGIQAPCSVSIGSSRCVISVAGVIPVSIADANTNGLKADPGCRRAWLARLKWLSLKLRPPTSTRTYPVPGSIDTIAPSR